MNKIKYFSFLVFLSLHSLAQSTISGMIKNQKQEALGGVSISIENSYSGTTSAPDGSFSFLVADSGTVKIVVSITGYKSFETSIRISTEPVVLNITLKESITELRAVIISAGSFEAGDKKRSTVLKSVDIVTTPGQQADIVSALKTLPGAQQVGETEGLFVRGGTGDETKVFIDGLMVSNPFYSSVPDIAQRGRFSPLLFKGTVFSSGAYSSQYGQALSSALVLESLDLPVRSESNWIISSAQMSVTGQKLNRQKNGSIGAGIAYTNLAPYFAVVKQKYNYNKAPELINTEFHGRQKTKKGILKFYGYASANTIAFTKAGVENADQLQQFRLANRNVYTNLTFTTTLKPNLKLYAGISYSYNIDKQQYYLLTNDIIDDYFLPVLSNKSSQARLVLTRSIAGLGKFHFGAEWQRPVDEIEAADSIPFISMHDNYFATFFEAEIYASTRFAARIGSRLEHSNMLKQTSLSPRISLACNLGGKSQVSAAFGHFYQKPETNFLFRNHDLSFTKALHYIFNYQYTGTGQLFRLELFQKKYSRMVTYPFNDPTELSNNGSGYAKGIEFFWRDKKTFKGFDYWISYSLLDTKRKFLDYPFKVQPGFAARHTSNLVVKKFAESISTYFSLVYTYASGRPYYNPNRPLIEFMKDRVIDFHSVGFQVNYLTQFGKAYAVLIFNMSNALGNRQVFNYRFASHRNDEGIFRSEAISPMAKRFYFIGAYISIGADRRKTIID